MQHDREPTRLVVVLEAGDGARERLVAAMQAAPVACVIIHTRPDETGRSTELAELIGLSRSGGAVALIVDAAELARTVGADGVHVSSVGDGDEHYTTARAILGAKATVGVHAGTSRHSAMEAGEAGADYIAFGSRDGAIESGEGTDSRLERIAWWSEVFEVPCIALDVGSADDALDLAVAGADFIAVTLAAGQSPAAAAEQIRALVAALDEAAHMRGA